MESIGTSKKIDGWMMTKSQTTTARLLSLNPVPPTGLQLDESMIQKEVLSNFGYTIQIPNLPWPLYSTEVIDFVFSFLLL